MKALSALLALALLALSACTPRPAEHGEGPALVTVFSASGTQSVAQEGLYARYGLGLETGSTGFDFQALQSLPQYTIATEFPIGAEARRFSGPRLSELLAASGATGASARLTAADGYQVDVSAEMIAAHQPILATHADGAALGLGGLGPAILVWPRGRGDALADMNDDLWVWGLFAIEALEA